jgi:hypothetical protein
MREKIMTQHAVADSAEKKEKDEEIEKLKAELKIKSDQVVDLKV